jgi:hypothetical protein
MAELQLATDHVTVRLSTTEKAAALHGNLKLPLASITRVTVSDTPRRVRGIRIKGTSVPGLVRIGSFRSWGHRTFAAAYRTPAVVIDLHGEHFDTVIVSVEDAEATCAAIQTARRTAR